MLLDKQIKNIQCPKEKSYIILYDIDGLMLYISRQGKKTWRIRYQVNKKQKLETIGYYPDLSLSKARDKAKMIKLNSKNFMQDYNHVGRLFSVVANEWYEKRMAQKAERYSRTISGRLDKHINPQIGNKPIDEITPREILDVIRNIEGTGHIETAHRCLSIISQVLRYAVATQEIERDFSADIHGALAMKPPVKHFATLLRPFDIARMLSCVSALSTESTKNLIMFHCYTLCRPGNARMAEWSEIDFTKRLWIIPAAKMKMREQHITPLSTQVMHILERQRTVVPLNCRWIFPQPRDYFSPMSDGTERVALQKIVERLGLDRKCMTPHGFRSMGSTILNENGFNIDAIERALAHSPSSGNVIRAIYNRYEYIEERKSMLQWYADYIDALRDGKELPEKSNCSKE